MNKTTNVKGSGIIKPASRRKEEVSKLVATSSDGGKVVSRKRFPHVHHKHETKKMTRTMTTTTTTTATKAIKPMTTTPEQMILPQRKQQPYWQMGSYAIYRHVALPYPGAVSENTSVDEPTQLLLFMS